jgi:ADP-dependent NAD(P)H-hydrate dehydratase / NAD(P)H-hydrate epimerase
LKSGWLLAIIAVMKILTSAQMREVDRLTTERFHIPGIVLMEQAAARTLEAIEKKLGELAGLHALILCGRGNNGGDGAAIARQLFVRGCRITLLLLGRVDDARGDARTNFEIARSFAATAGSGFRFVEIESANHLEQEFTTVAPDFFIDAMFGTGLTRAAGGLFEDAIRRLGERSDDRPVISVDIPSGISSDSAELIGPAVRAHLTVTFTAPKIGNVFPPACDYGGELIVGQIGSPDELIAVSGSRLTLVEREMIERALSASRRSSRANKSDAGKVLIIAGSRGKTGAACLAGEGAMRAGAGLVTIAAPRSSQTVIAVQAIAECMTEPLEETEAGTISRDAWERAIELAAERDVLAIGPGLGSSDESTRTFVRAVAINRERPVVIDADGLNSLAPWAENLRGSADLPIILTPHPGEMARLVAIPTAEVLANRIEVAREFATSHSVIVVLKGSRTLVAAPDGEVYVNPTGNPGLATGGTGDVLTGMIAGLLAQKRDDPLAATISAVYLHGLAGDIAAARVGTRAMIASDVSAHLGDAFIEVGGDREKGGQGSGVGGQRKGGRRKAEG